MISHQPVGFSLAHISRNFQSRSGDVHALADVSFKVAPEEFVCIVGPSGCGKSTILKILAGLEQPDTGQLRFDALPGVQRPRTALVFQEHGLFPWMTVLDNVAFGLEMLGMPRGERTQRAHPFLAQMGLEAFGSHFPHELSGGMRQRAAIARAVLIEPQLLLMDEPFSALDAQSKLVLQEDLLRLWKDSRQTVVYITHDIEEAVILGDRVLVMSGRPGRILEEIQVPLSRPRDLRDRDQPALREITWHIWKAIEAEVRQSLHMGRSIPS
jgi:NitT/TauT family transport system ATP-binding protein